MYRPKPENRPIQKSLYDEQDLNKLKFGFLKWLHLIEVTQKFATAFTLNHGPFGKPNPAQLHLLKHLVGQNLLSIIVLLNMNLFYDNNSPRDYLDHSMKTDKFIYTLLVFITLC